MRVFVPVCEKCGEVVSCQLSVISHQLSVVSYQGAGVRGQGACQGQRAGVRGREQVSVVSCQGR